MINVLKAGFFTTVQDAGRFGYQHFGVPISGAMNTAAFKLANNLVGNLEDKAVFECTLSGPRLEFLKHTMIAITGANMNPILDGEAVKMNHALTVKKGSILELGMAINGFRTYIAVNRGLISQTVMDSQSLYQHITKIIKVNDGDTIDYPTLNSVISKQYAMVQVDNNYKQDIVLEVYKGQEFDRLNCNQQNMLFEKPFTISKFHNRMAYRLNESLENTIKPIITSLVIPGTVQLTPSGNLIILHRDCQTTGGYPRVLQLSETALNSLAQKCTNDTVKFRLRNLDK